MYYVIHDGKTHVTHDDLPGEKYGVFRIANGRLLGERWEWKKDPKASKTEKHVDGVLMEVNGYRRVTHERDLDACYEGTLTIADDSEQKRLEFIMGDLQDKLS